jgi:hypothetical protein
MNVAACRWAADMGKRRSVKANLIRFSRETAQKARPHTRQLVLRNQARWLPHDGAHPLKTYKTIGYENGCF